MVHSYRSQYVIILIDVINQLHDILQPYIILDVAVTVEVARHPSKIVQYFPRQTYPSSYDTKYPYQQQYYTNLQSFPYLFPASLHISSGQPQYHLYICQFAQPSMESNQQLHSRQQKPVQFDCNPYIFLINSLQNNHRITIHQILQQQKQFQYKYTLQFEITDTKKFIQRYMLWQNYICSSPPQYKQLLNSSTNILNKQPILSSNKKSKQKLQLNSKSKSKSMKKVMHMKSTSQKKSELEDSCVSVLFARQFDHKKTQKKNQQYLQFQPILQDIREIAREQLACTKQLVKLLEEKSVMGVHPSHKKQKSTIKKKKFDGLSLQDRVNKKLRLDCKVKNGNNNTVDVKRSCSTLKKQKNSCSFIKGMR